MDPISQLECLVSKEVITQESLNSLTPIILGLNGMSQSDLLVLLIAINLTGVSVTP
jgi:hypothetical protein